MDKGEITVKKNILSILTILLITAATPAFCEITLSEFSTYNSKIDGFEAKIVTPLIRGLADKKNENELNHNFRVKAKAAISEYENYVVEETNKSPKTEGHFALISDVIVKTNNKRILAFDYYSLNVVGSSSTKHEFYTFIKDSGKLLTLKELLKKQPNYVQKISKYIRTEMKRINKKENGMFWVERGSQDEFKKIKEDQNFYINDEGSLVVCFDKYEVAAGAQGSPEFIIPTKITGVIL